MQIRKHRDCAVKTAEFYKIEQNQNLYLHKMETSSLRYKKVGDNIIVYVGGSNFIGTKKQFSRYEQNRVDCSLHIKTRNNIKLLKKFGFKEIDYDKNIL